MIILFIIFLNSSLNMILLSTINNEDISVEFKIEYFFNMININLQIYPLKNKPKKKKRAKDKEKSKTNKWKGKSEKITKYDILQVYFSIRKTPIEEIYSSINFGGTNIHFVCFIHLLINTIYGNLINIFNQNKIHLDVIPNFTDNYIKAKIKINIKPKIKNIIEIGYTILKIYIKSNKKIKEGKGNERTWINKKSYGNNS